MTGASIFLSPLFRADGSASYTCPSTGSNILGSVNAPVELQGRRDALRPEEATIEVSVKPGTYQAGVCERHVEGILKGVLSKLILGREKGFPRRGVALSLVVIGGENATRKDSYLFMLPALLHTALLALLSAAVPLSMTTTSTTLAVTASGDITRVPLPKSAGAITSTHVLAFSSKGHLLLNESVGTFSFDTWERVYRRAFTICHSAETSGLDGDDTMVEDADGCPLEERMRQSVEDKIRHDNALEVDTS